MESKRPLLEESYEQTEFAEYQIAERKSRHERKRKLYFGWRADQARIAPKKIWSNSNSSVAPASHVLKHEKQVFYSNVKNNPFAGPPRPELDEAWHGLLRNIHIRVSKEELDAIGGSSLELSDGSGYVGSLEVYHDLHCLKRIRHWIYRDTYLSNMTTDEYDFNLFHTEHCLEHLRELVMCRGDVALTNFYYRRHQPTARLLAEHECVNWKAIDNWAGGRVIDLSMPGLVLSEELSKHEVVDSLTP